MTSYLEGSVKPQANTLVVKLVSIPTNGSTTSSGASAMLPATGQQWPQGSGTG